MNEKQEIRAKALELTIAMLGKGRERELFDRAERLAQWIETGERPEQEPGAMY